MGLPGETVKIQDGILYINGEATNFRQYSNLGIGDNEWRIPKKGDKLEIIPAGNYKMVWPLSPSDILYEQGKANWQQNPGW